jgi:pimeloyl-ACP methyl ester carboxylesterase
VTQRRTPAQQCGRRGQAELYPYPVRFLPLRNDLQPVVMAYMDIPPSTGPNGMTVVLFHGKAFGCYYFLNVIQALTGAGYRVVAPDQIGWGKSAKPDIHYSQGFTSWWAARRFRCGCRTWSVRTISRHTEQARWPH